MNILIDIGHPAHVHVFKHYHDLMKAEGHTVLFTSKKKECTLDLLEAYNLPYENLGNPYSGALNKIYGLWHFGNKLSKIAVKQQTDLFLSISSMYAAHVAWSMKKPHIVLDDTEHSRFEHMLYRPFSSHILTPSCFEKHMGKKQISYDGYHELAYLHPNRFKPSSDIRKVLGLDEKEPFTLLRFVSWNAGHDLKAKGLTLTQKLEMVNELKNLSRVFISSEKELPAELEEMRVSIRPEQMHDVLNEASLYVGEGASMASECAMLGTPAIYINSLDAGTLKEQEAYGLIHNFRNYAGALDAAKAILIDSESEKIYADRRALMLSEKIDVTALLVTLSQKILAADQQEIESIYTKLNYKLA